MSQQIAHSPQFVMVPVRESNGLGVAGFFIALIGLVIPTGIVALLGLLISLVALGKAPRGFAGMGVVVGLFGTVVWMALTGAFILGAAAIGMVALIVGAGLFILTQPELIEVTSDMINTSLVLVEYQEDQGKLPANLAVLGLGISTSTDPWGNAYRYSLVEDEPGFDLISNGGDGIPETDDDISLSRIDVVLEDAADSFEDKVNKLFERLDRIKAFDQHHARHRRADRASRYEREAIAAAAAAESAGKVKANLLEEAADDEE